MSLPKLGSGFSRVAIPTGARDPEAEVRLFAGALVVGNPAGGFEGISIAMGVCEACAVYSSHLRPEITVERTE
ncbi:hypothetical protein HPP92_020770 [Vanilla planifolia]|uniref:Uncharacterized protein n=1 Tax=Vanilla planifolia TaxID=51239 RepID=A0A835Q0M1_VANPL|nr:hypothetical protein HPP92_020770 [Vanilla planifolia]